MHFTVDVTAGEPTAFTGQPEVEQVCELLAGISRDDILERQSELAATRAKAPAGGQTALNEVLASRFEAAEWEPDSQLFEKGVPVPGAFRLHFVRGRAGVVVSTHNRGFLIRNLTILQVAATGPQERQRVHTPLALLLIPTGRMKSWSRMDQTVADSREARAVVSALRSVISAPIGIIGLDAADSITSDWQATTAFPGSKAQART